MSVGSPDPEGRDPSRDEEPYISLTGRFPFVDITSDLVLVVVSLSLGGAWPEVFPFK